jgi:polyisoprenoid-binding protein YceI
MRQHATVPLLIALALAPRSVPAQSAEPDSIVYTITPASRLEVQTAKAGLLAFAGHEHTIRARAFVGRIVYYPSRPSASHVTITVPAESLEVLTPPDTEEIRKVTAAMRTEVLEVERYPEIVFASRGVQKSADTMHVLGTLMLHGQRRDVPVVVHVVIDADTLRASTSFKVKQTAFGMRPYRGGPGGTVRVADPVTFTIDAVAVRTATP